MASCRAGRAWSAALVPCPVSSRISDTAAAGLSFGRCSRVDDTDDVDLRVLLRPGEDHGPPGCL